MQAEVGQFLLDFGQGRIAKIANFQQFVLGLTNQRTNGVNVLRFEAIGGSHRKLQFGNA